MTGRADVANRLNSGAPSVVSLALLVVLAWACAYWAEAAPSSEVGAMTEAQARQRIPKRSLPAFWIGHTTDLERHLRGLRRCEVTTLAKTPGGRTMHLVTFGHAEPLEHKANFNSAVGARQPEAYADKATRDKPVVLFVGPVHGHEVEAMTGLVNLIHIIEHGKDLRGKGHSTLKRLAERCRILIIPAGNPDGVARFELRTLQGMDIDDVRFWGQGTWSDNTFCGWPQVKRLHPIVESQIAFLGCYFNDAGVNPMHDEFFDPMGPEAPAILKVANVQAPDLAVSLHSHGSNPALLRPAYMPREVQEDIRTLAVEYYELLDKKGLPHAKPFEATIEGGKRLAPFNLTSAIYHISGARTFTFECPHGIKMGCEVSLDEILDIQLTLYEGMLRHELKKKQ